MRHKRLYISADIEGVCGVVSGQQLDPRGFEYAEARRWMTDEVACVCRAALEHGVEHIVVSDSHGNGQNILPDALPDNVELVRSWPRPLGMMEGIDIGGFDGAILLGYHTGATDPRGVLAHTMSSRGIRDVRLNGVAASETMISAAIAGHFGVPIVLASGDDAYAGHVADLLPGVETVTTKYALGLVSARMRPPKAVAEDLAAAVSAVVAKPVDGALYRIDAPIELSVRCASRAAAELLEYLPGFDRRDADTVSVTAETVVEVSRLLMFLTVSGVLDV